MDLEHLYSGFGLGIGDATRHGHQINYDLVTNANDEVVPQIVITQFENSFVGENLQRFFGPGLILE